MKSAVVDLTVAEPYPIETYIEKPVEEVRRFLAQQRNYARWAAVDEATFRQVGILEWAAETEFGPRIIRFSPPNDDGIFDHAVYKAGDEPVMMPLRAMAQGEGTLVTFMFYRRPGMDDEQLASALEWIRMDFAVLKSLLEV
jgi:hypothetical protein